jgi:putative CocE/NonD family hydrolase
MRLPTWAVRTLFILLAAVVLIGAAALVINLRSGGGGTGQGLADRTRSITTSDGVKLSAEVIGPQGTGPFPLLVMPASWNSPALEYRTLGARFAAAGVDVVAYAQRGFRGSGGEADLGGRKSQQDVSSVIDWALKNTNADPTRIGVFGVSYGGGVGLLAAAHDSRIKAVVATSAWSDLAAALSPSGTLNLAGLGWLFAAPDADNSLDPQVSELEKDVKNDPAAAAALLKSMSASRSAASLIGALNKNHPAIMIANAFDDSLLDPTSLVSFYEKLHTPKRLQLAIGDHGGPEILGLRGEPDPTVETGAKWIDHYLNKTKNGIQRGGQIVLQDGATGKTVAYNSWPAVSTTLQLGTPGNSGSLGASPAGSWSRPLTTGSESGATSGAQQIQAIGTYQPSKISIGSVQPSDAYVWSAPAGSRAVQVTGTPTLQVNVASSASPVTLFSYLYDVNASGSATLMTYAPATVSSGKVAITLRPVSWTVAAGHHVVLVVDTADKNFQAVEPTGSTLTLSSPASLSV